MRITEADIREVCVSRLTAAGFNVIATEVKEGFEKPAVFVNVYPSTVTLAGTDLEDVTDTIDVQYIPAEETTQNCAEAAVKIRDCFMYRTLDVKNRHFTVESMETDIDDHILNVYFDVNYTQETPNGEEYENMEELRLGGIY